VIPTVDLPNLSLGAPQYLWLLVVPALLLAAWGWQLWRRLSDRRRTLQARVVPVREQLPLVGNLPFWLCVILASALVAVALARPRGPATVVREGGLDIVILQDASASMHVRDVSGNRWRRSMQFIRTLTDALSWKNDRIAMAVFAHIAAPQVRLTRDPNVFLFFLDHLSAAPPFRIEDETTWDTNLELGIHWGLRVIERDGEQHGRSPNAQMFILLTDGEAWSGEVANALKRAAQESVPVNVIGVGTLGGGAMPILLNPDGTPNIDPETPTSSRLDRPSLQRVAATGGGRYFELDRDGDRQIASRIVDAGRRQAPKLDSTEEAEDLYWYVLASAALLVAVGILFLRERSELLIHLAGASAIFVAMYGLLR
jgi:Ca-activated chloride channel family protein